MARNVLNEGGTLQDREMYLESPEIRKRAWGVLCFESAGLGVKEIADCSSVNRVGDVHENHNNVLDSTALC